MQKFWTSDRRLYFNADKTEILEDGDPKGAFLYASKGTRVPFEFAVKHGLVAPAKAAPKSKPKAKPKSANKAAPKSPNKSTN